MQPHIDYVGPINILMSEAEQEKLLRIARRSARMIMGLGRNVKNKMIDCLISTNRRASGRQGTTRLSTIGKPKDAIWEVRRKSEKKELKQTGD